MLSHLSQIGPSSPGSTQKNKTKLRGQNYWSANVATPLQKFPSGSQKTKKKAKQKQTPKGKQKRTTNKTTKPHAHSEVLHLTNSLRPDFRTGRERSRETYFVLGARSQRKVKQKQKQTKQKESKPKNIFEKKALCFGNFFSFKQKNHGLSFFFHGVRRH